MYRIDEQEVLGLLPTRGEETEAAMAAAATLKREIEAADAVLVGAASGMSTAAGFNYYYSDTLLFYALFGDFARKYGYRNSFDGFYYRYGTCEERWAFMARSMYANSLMPAGQPYHDIVQILGDKPYHVVCTNQDARFALVIDEQKLSSIQGDFRYLQCIDRCHDGVWRSEEIVAEANAQIEDCKIPSKLVPRCPKCGAIAEPWVRGYDFLEGTKYREEYRKAQQFIKEYADKHLLFLELGVGRMTPMFIQEPFWELTYTLPKARYVTINPQHAIVPPLIKDKSVAINQSILDVFWCAANTKEA